MPAKPLALHPQLLAWGSVPGMGRGLPWGPDLGTPRVMRGKALVPLMAPTLIGLGCVIQNFISCSES